MDNDHIRTHVHSGEEQKPSLSALNAALQSPLRKVEISPYPIFGPQRSIPDHLADLLEEWHRKNGNTRPPCVYWYGRGAVLQWKVFDRQGKQLQLSLYDVIRPCSYQVLVLHRPDSPETLVRSRLPHVSKHGSYMIAWLGLSKGFEAQCCALRMFAPRSQVVTYKPEAWNFNIPDLDPEGKGLKKAMSLAALQTRPVDRDRERQGTQGLEKVGRMITRSAFKKWETVRRRTDAQNSPESSEETDSSADGPLDTAVCSSSSSSADASSDVESSSSEEEEGDQTAVPSSRKRKLQHQPSHTQVKLPMTTNLTKVTIKLISYKSGAIRAFPLMECKTGRDLFHKAQTFFLLFDRGVEVKILSCQISSERTQHYLFEGSEGEFGLLIEHAKNVSSSDGEIVTIEVNHVLEP